MFATMVHHKASAVNSNNGARKVVLKKSSRSKPSSRRLLAAASSLPIDQQLQQQDKQPEMEQDQHLHQQPLQLPQPHADTVRTNTEEDALSEASTLDMGGPSSPLRFCSPSPSRVCSPSSSRICPPDVLRTVPREAKRQRVRKDGAVESHGRSCATAVSSGLVGQPTNTVAALASAVVQHEVVPRMTGRAKRTVSRCPRVFTKEIFTKRAEEACAALPQDLANRGFQYLSPLIGRVCCDFIGKSIDNNCHEIVADDVVIFRWSYMCTLKPDIQIKGFSDSHHSARTIAIGELPPRTTSVMVNAIVLAKVYEKLSPELCPFVRKYCHRNKLDVGECKILNIGFPKQLAQIPSIEDFVDNSGMSAKWMQCACIGNTGKLICHPGASAGYSNNRFSYSVRELRVLGTKDKKESMPDSFKLRKRPAIHKDKYFPASVDNVNFGKHSGVRDVIAYGTALAEFELAKYEGRNISVAAAMKGFDLDPFAWEESVGWNTVVVLWKSSDGKHHLQSGTLRKLLGMITKTAVGPDAKSQTTSSK